MNMDIERNKCKNKKCQNILPEGAKQKYCEACRLARAERRKKAGQTLLDLMCAPGIVSMRIATRGNRHYDTGERK